MVRSKGWFATMVGVALLLTGCGGSRDSGADAQGAEVVVGEFLAAVKKGDDRRASELLTQVARQKTTEMEMVVAPPGSDTASYKVLASEVEGNQAQVGTDWTDLDGDGRPRTDRLVWMLRHGAEGWRICGMATRVFPDMPPTLLNFEDPEDMLRKQQQAEEEIARRDAQTQDSTTEGAPSANESTVR
jgi:hypothetical protein